MALVKLPFITQPVPLWVMVPLFVKFMSSSTKISPSTMVQVPVATVMVPLFVNTALSPKVVLGLVPKGTVQPEEIVTSAAVAPLVITTELNGEPLQVIVLSSALLLATKLTVPLLWLKVPAVKVTFLSTDKVALVEVVIPPVWVNEPSVIVMLLLPPANVPEATEKPELPILIVDPLAWVTVPV